MKVLVVGSGGREHALVWKLAQSPLVDEIYCAPGNAGIAGKATLVEIAADDIDALAGFASANNVDLTLVGPELPLTLGIVDRFEQEGLGVFGPSKAAAQIEGSKAFAKELMESQGIPTAIARTFTDSNEAKDYVRETGAPLVIKADGLAAGKGVLVCRETDEALAAVETVMEQRAFGEAGNKVVVEEFLEGEEASFIALTDGKHVLPLASSQDHKPVYDDDQGPNTGGMGAYSPAPVVTSAMHEKIMSEVMIPAVQGMAAKGMTYRGVLYAGLMIKDGVPKVLEFNARFGDPETQPLFARMKSDLLPLLTACMNQTLAEHAIEWIPGAAVCVVMASGGYPDKYEKGKVISGLERAGDLENVMVFHAGTARRDQDVVTAGGRVLGVTAVEPSIPEAIDKAYRAVDLIAWDGRHFRRDIGRKALKYL